MAETIRFWMAKAHEVAVSKGWWDGGDRNVAEQIALFHSELSEALEEWRRGRPLTEVRIEDGKPEGFPIELADALIRIFDTCETYGIDLEGAVRTKMEYNATRPYRHGGKVA